MMAEAPTPAMNPTSGTARLIAACRAALLNTLDAFAQEQGYMMQSCRDALLHAAGECHDELAGFRDRRGFEQAKGLTASRISLVHEHDLDFTLELTDLARRLRERCEAELSRLHVRYMRLLEQSDASIEQIPVGPETVCCALRALANEAGLDADERLRLVENALEPLANALRKLYRDLNRELDTAGIRLQGIGRPVPRAVADGPSGADAPPDAEQPADAGQTRDGSPLSQLQDALLGQRPASGGGAVALDPKLAASIMDQVQTWLTERQQTTDAAAPQLGTSELGPLLAPRTAAAVETIERVFAYIAADADLPAAVKTALVRLQIPLLKLALRDDRVLADGEHPARRLIDTIAALGATLPSGAAEHPLCGPIDALTSGLRRQPDPGLDAFAAAHAEAAALAEQRRAVAFACAADAQDLGDMAERRELALHFASRALSLLVDGDTPGPIRDFLETHWLAVLSRTIYRRGEKHADAKELLEIANLLVLSGRPTADSQVRRELVANLPQLIRRIDAGLAKIGMDEDARRAALGPCMDLHSALIAGRPVRTDVRSVPAEGTLALSRVRDRALLRLLHHPGFAPGQLRMPTALAGLKPGDWLVLDLPDGRTMRGCVTWLGPARRLALIANPDDGQVLAATLRALAELASKEQCRRIDDGSLIERAAQQLLAALKG